MQYYVFNDFNTFLQKKRIKEILSDRRNYTQPLLGNPDLNSLKAYVFNEQKIHFLAV